MENFNILELKEWCGNDTGDPACEYTDTCASPNVTGNPACEYTA